MKDPATKHKTKPGVSNPQSENEKKKKAFDRGLHNDSKDDQKENILNKDKTIVNTQSEDKITNTEGQ